MNLTLDALPDWMNNAACADSANADFFFPSPGKRSEVRRAKAFCASCPVAIKCLKYALDQESGHRQQMHGVYGGMTPTERAHLIKSRSNA